MGIEQDAKEGQAFDRELQEKLKADRVAEREGKRKAQEKEQKKRTKEAKKREKERKKAEKKAAKNAKKEALQKAKVKPFCSTAHRTCLSTFLHTICCCVKGLAYSPVPAAIHWQPDCVATRQESTGLKLICCSCQEEEQRKAKQVQLDAERAQRQAEAKEKRQRDLQARLGPRAAPEQPSSREHRSRREPAHRSSHREERPPSLAEAPVPVAPDPAERYVPREPTPERLLTGSSPEADPASMPPPASQPLSGQFSSLSPTPALRRSGTPSPSPAKVCI